MITATRALRALTVLSSAACLAALVSACGGAPRDASAAAKLQPSVSASPSHSPSPKVSPSAKPKKVHKHHHHHRPLSAPSSPLAQAPAPAGACRGGAQLWANLASCGWPGPTDTGPDLAQCPGGRLTPHGGSLGQTITISKADTVISCEDITGMLDVEAKNVIIENSAIISNSGKTGTDANGTSDILVDHGASATIDHVRINGDDGVHACIWHQGTSLTVNAVDCYGVDDGIFSWTDPNYSNTTGDNFTIKDSYFHDFTTRTSNGHEDGYQTAGAANGLIEHNTYRMTTAADSAIAIWDALGNSRNITVTGNLISGGGFAIYAEDLDPGDGGPGDPGAAGGFTITGMTFTDNVFSTQASGCVGAFGVWFARPTWSPYFGGPTDGWHRSGNRVLETGQDVDNSNPSSHGRLCT